MDVERFHAGDERLFADLVRSYSPRLVPQLRRYAASSADVADLLQDVWLRAFQKRRSFDARGSLYGWLLSICRTVGLNHAARRGATLEKEVGAERPPAVAPVGDIDRRIDHERLLHAVDELPPRQRAVVLLRLAEDRSTAETARMLGCAEGTVKAALHAAVHKLQAIMKEKVG